MRYLMKEKFFALGDDFTIQDENGRDRFFVDGKTFSLGDQLSFQDLRGTELAFISRSCLRGERRTRSTAVAGSPRS